MPNVYFKTFPLLSILGCQPLFGSDNEACGASDRQSTTVAPGHSSRMDGKVFDWSWSNVPFASTCEARPDAK
jgi:hypothetical protein